MKSKHRRRHSARLAACLLAVCMAGSYAPVQTAVFSGIIAHAQEETIAENLTLDRDMTVDGDLTIEGGSVSLNGHTLSVTGSVSIESGSLQVGSGRLNVGGDLIMSRSKEAAGAGSISMTSEAGVVSVEGDFCHWTSEMSELTGGTMYIGGNFDGSKSGDEGGFHSWNTHTVCFTGSGIHEIYFNSADDPYNRLNLVSMSGSGQLLLTGMTTGFYAASDLVFADGSRLDAGAILHPEGHILTAAGDFTLNGEIDLGTGTFLVRGSLTQPEGILYADRGTLYVAGDYIVALSKDGAGSGSLHMNDPESSVTVDGDFIQWSSAVSELTGGTMYIGGNFEGSKAAGEGGFHSWNSHTVCFTGDGIHEIYFNSADDAYNRLNMVSMSGSGQLLLTGRTTGFTMASDLNLADGSKLAEGAALHTEGHTLTAAGDFTFSSEIDLGTGTFRIKGSLIQPEGTMRIGRGTLNVAGDYIVASSKNSAGSGSLFMDYAEGVVVVGGDFFQWSNAQSDLSAGLMSVYGNFEGSKSGGEGGFNAWNTHTIEFLGGGGHEIYLNSTGGNQLNTIRMAAGDSITFTKRYNGVEGGKSIEISPASLASVQENKVTALANGEGTITCIGDTSLSRTLLVGDSGAPAPFDGTLPEITPGETVTVMGDVSGDSVFGVMDVIVLQKWLVREQDARLSNWKNADYTKDNRIDIRDLACMKRALTGGVPQETPLRITEAPATIAAGSISCAYLAFGTFDPTGTDAWIGLIPAGTPDGEYAADEVDVCYTYLTETEEDGMILYRIPENTAPGSYELRVYANDSGGELLTRRAVTITEPVTFKFNSLTVKTHVDGGYVIVMDATYAGIDENSLAMVICVPAGTPDDWESILKNRVNWYWLYKHTSGQYDSYAAPYLESGSWEFIVVSDPWGGRILDRMAVPDSIG
ncbi:MAG: hypothetical protein IJ595_10050 [Oscillospiraceae bacterium]|nr:hypothetical protein [Oscillospiraceae bacterium]